MPQVIPDPVLIGYFAKPTIRRPDWLKASWVEEICSASDCISGGDWDWINEWRHNAEWVYDTPELAWSVVPESARKECELFAYQMFPVRFRKGVAEPYPLPPAGEWADLEFAPLPIDASFERLGFDLVTRSCGNSFECSPLSCNHLAESVPVNRHCLLSTAEEAFALAPTLEVPGQPMRGEPGPYHIVEVWRQRVSAPAS